MALRNMGFREFRVRSHEDLARIEFGAAELEKGFEQREALAKTLRDVGFMWTTLDMTPFQSGSMNQMLGKSVTESTP